MEEPQDDNETACNEYIIQEITVIGDKPIRGLGTSETVNERLLVIDKGESLSKFIERVTKPLSDLKSLKAVRSDESIESDDETEKSKKPTDGRTPSGETSSDDSIVPTSESDKEKTESDEVAGVKPGTSKPLRDGSKEEIESVKDLDAKDGADKTKSDERRSALSWWFTPTKEQKPKVEQLPIDVTDESLADQPSDVTTKPTPADEQPSTEATTKPIESEPSEDDRMVSGAVASPETATTADITSDQHLDTSTTPASTLDKVKSDEKQKEADAAKIDTTKPQIEDDTKTDEPIRDLAATTSADKTKIDETQSTLGTTSSTQDDKQRSESSKGTADDSTSESYAGKSTVGGKSSDITTPVDDDTDNDDEDIEALVYGIMSKVDKLFAKNF